MYSLRKFCSPSLLASLFFSVNPRLLVIYAVLLASSKIMCDKRQILPHVLAFVGRRQLFLQSTPIGRGVVQDDLSVSPLMFTDAADNTSCSKRVLVLTFENNPGIYNISFCDCFSRMLKSGKSDVDVK